MTEHPLTDEKLLELIPPELIKHQCNVADAMGLADDWVQVSDAMRLAADWQLEKVVAHIITAEWFEDPEWRITQLRKAMRPTQENN